MKEMKQKEPKALKGKSYKAKVIAAYKVKGAWEVHHVLPISKGGSNKASNVVALSPANHAKAHYYLKQLAWPTSASLEKSMEARERCFLGNLRKTVEFQLQQNSDMASWKPNWKARYNKAKEFNLV
jgi:5-methylcytosine-specific restriction endonuclease McrA